MYLLFAGIYEKFSFFFLSKNKYKFQFQIAAKRQDIQNKI